MKRSDYIFVAGKRDEKRISSRVLEEIIQQHAKKGNRKLEIQAFGQHGIGGRLWESAPDTMEIRIIGHSGQRTGSLGTPYTRIEIMGPASDDIGWLNAGAEIIVHGSASNGAMNGAAQGKVFVGGCIGARGMTMTKRNPRFEPPELWVLGAAGDYFGEFMAGGIAVVCGVNAANPDQLLGYRPLVGMVGGKVFVRGEAQSYSDKDAKEVDLDDKEWEWLTLGLKDFLKKIKQPDLFKELAVRKAWRLFEAKNPQEKADGPDRKSMSWFREQVWDMELGRGGLIGDLQETQKGTVPVITKGEYRRYVPVWEQGKYISPCQASCPTGIPVQQRWAMVRADNIDEAISMGLEYSPFPATVCGHLCPSPCMASCTRNMSYMAPINVRLLGQAAQNIKPPKPAQETQKKVAVIGGGPGGISAAWQLTMKGHTVTIFEAGKTIGGKISAVIPESRIPADTLNAELDRIKSYIKDIRLGEKIDAEKFNEIKNSHDYVVVAAGAKKPRSLPIKGVERALFANDFLEQAKADKIKPGKKIVVIGAGNVGCDVATEAHRLGAVDITLIDVQKPAAFGKEREDAEKCGAQFRWPLFTKEINAKGVELQSGEILPADTVVISIGDVPDLSFLGEGIELTRGFVKVDETGRSSDEKVFAIGDAVGPGLITDAIGAGRRTARVIDQLLKGQVPDIESLAPMIDTQRVSLTYYNPRQDADNIESCGEDCASCGNCKDCGICVAVCPEAAISRKEKETGFEYVVDESKCIGCGFCKGACPCGIWELIPNTPLM
ncbi:MAG: FAD-dependent oxidoreductase [Desulfobacter sp.]|uniref:FAD-dependent oxidoreductase n=1 Tax=Desulfobacter sp. TaxID=2294 RepID=UPI001B50CF11|nr:FAD-dependent oxidoreductase [Desulfobacter sp.]MBP8830175.1 FAD-dependent oxidoreductase [Desulfobacter sp.]MBP9598559.1 FAD-dependent oxidoreductase [Desulfobacter sp.]